MLYKVLVDGRFMEGWKIGDVIELDDIAAEGPLKENAIEKVEKDLTKVERLRLKVEQEFEKKLPDMISEEVKRRLQKEKKDKQTEEDLGKLPEASEYTDDYKFKCTICGKNHKIDSKIGQEHLKKMNKKKQ